MIESAIAAATEYGQPFTVGIMSTLPDSPVQSNWIIGMEKARENYPVDIAFEIKYTQNVQANGANLVDAFNAMDNIKGFTTLSTTTISPAVNALAASGSSLNMTGCTWPSTIIDFMPTAQTQDVFSAPIPWGLGWDFEAWGHAVGAAAAQVLDDSYDGSVGSELLVHAYGDYPEKTLITGEATDGGTQVFAQDVVVFTHENIEAYTAQELSGADLDILLMK